MMVIMTVHQNLSKYCCTGKQNVQFFVRKIQQSFVANRYTSAWLGDNGAKHNGVSVVMAPSNHWYLLNTSQKAAWERIETNKVKCLHVNMTQPTTHWRSVNNSNTSGYLGQN